MGATDFRQPIRKPFPFDRLRVPFLSILGSEDYPAVQRMAADIRSRMTDFAPLSAQQIIPGADHYYGDYEDAWAYWTFGVSGEIEGIGWDISYWDTDLSGDPLADSRVVFTISKSL